MTRALAAALAVLAAATAAHAADQSLAIGGAAPDTALVDMRGQPVRLAELLGKHDWVVVAFYVNAFTGG